MLGHGVRGLQEGFWRRAAAAVQPVAAPKTRVRFLFRRQAEEEYEEDMRRLASFFLCFFFQSIIHYSFFLLCLRRHAV